MLAVVKMPRTKTTLFEVRGNVPKTIIDYLKQKYTVEVVKDSDEDYVEVTKSDWYQDMASTITPGDTMKIYRENIGLSQAKLGEKLGGISRHKISDYENGRRSIGKELAKKLSRFFEISVERFL